MKLLILSDIHGNITALNTVLSTALKSPPDGCILLGDIIDYGLHSNLAVKKIQALPYPLLCNIRGNHENAVITGDYSHFSTERGIKCAEYTRSILDGNSWDYIKNTMQSSGVFEFTVSGRLCLAVHGSLGDEYWQAIFPDSSLSGYEKYDYVFSGHSHLPHFFEHFYPVDNPKMRNKKKTVFINPGSVGQPRNHNPSAQYAILDTESGEIEFKAVSYDIIAEQADFNGQIDEFYNKRLNEGI